MPNSILLKDFIDEFYEFNKQSGINDVWPKKGIKIDSIRLGAADPNRKISISRDDVTKQLKVFLNDKMDNKFWYPLNSKIFVTLRHWQKMYYLDIQIDSPSGKLLCTLGIPLRRYTVLLMRVTFKNQSIIVGDKLSAYR